MDSVDTQIGFTFFIIITVLYFFISYLIGRPSKQKKTKTVSFAIDFGYFLLLGLSQFLLNLQITAGMCNNTYQYTTAMYVTIVPWVLIFGILNLMIMIFPGWLSPFSNTFGYLITTLFGVKDKIKAVFKTPDNPNNEKEREIINYIYGNQSLLINEITMQNIGDENNGFVKSMKALLNTDYNTPTGVNKDEPSKLDLLKDMIYLKESVAKFFWYILSGSLVVSISTNSIINSGCNYNESKLQELSNISMVRTNTGRAVGGRLR